MIKYTWFFHVEWPELLLFNICTFQTQIKIITRKKHKFKYNEYDFRAYE